MEWNEREDLEYKVRELRGLLDDANREIARLRNELYSANFRIDNELEPRIALDKRAYDNYVTNGER